MKFSVVVVLLTMVLSAMMTFYQIKGSPEPQPEVLQIYQRLLKNDYVKAGMINNPFSFTCSIICLSVVFFHAEDTRLRFFLQAITL